MGSQLMLSNAAPRMKFLVFCGLLALASANKIHRVEVYTSDCFQCGMSVLGKISLEVYGQGGRYCNTGLLDNVGTDDFNRAPSAPLQAAPLATATTTTWVTPRMTCP